MNFKELYTRLGLLCRTPWSLEPRSPCSAGQSPHSRGAGRGLSSSRRPPPPDPADSGAAAGGGAAAAAPPAPPPALPPTPAAAASLRTSSRARAASPASASPRQPGPGPAPSGSAAPPYAPPRRTPPTTTPWVMKAVGKGWAWVEGAELLVQEWVEVGEEPLVQGPVEGEAELLVQEG